MASNAFMKSVQITVPAGLVAEATYAIEDGASYRSFSVQVLGLDDTTSVKLDVTLNGADYVKVADGAASDSAGCIFNYDLHAFCKGAQLRVPAGTAGGTLVVNMYGNIYIPGFQTRH